MLKQTQMHKITGEFTHGTEVFGKGSKVKAMIQPSIGLYQIGMQMDMTKHLRQLTLLQMKKQENLLCMTQERL